MKEWSFERIRRYRYLAQLEWLLRRARLRLQWLTLSLQIREVQKSFRSINLEKPIVLVLVRNGENFIPAFLDHYAGMGFEEFVFLDNGSTDATRTLLSQHPGITVVYTRAPYRKYQRAMQYYLVRRYGRGRWSLSVDVDEHFNYPNSERTDLTQFTAVLKKNKWNAVLAHQLDMFGDCDVTAPECVVDKKDYPYYSCADIARQSYAATMAARVGPVPTNREDRVFLSGGVRKIVFGTNSWLTKTPLLYYTSPLIPMLETHFVANADLAPFACVLQHYKLVSGLKNQVVRANEARPYQNMTPYVRALGMLGAADGVRVPEAVEEISVFRSMSALADCFPEIVVNEEFAPKGFSNSSS